MQELTTNKNLHGNNTQLTEKETREVLTPFAFKLDQSLFGLPIAKPWRRGVALLIDFALIAMLSNTSGELLAIVIAITFYHLASKKRSVQLGKIKGHKRRATIRFFSALIIFIILADTMPVWIKDITANFGENNSSTFASKPIEENTSELIAELLLEVVILVTASDCKNVNCWEGELTPIVTKTSKFSLADDEIFDAFNAVADATALNESDKKILTQSLLKQFNRLKNSDSFKQKIIKNTQLENLPKPNLPFKVISPEKKEVVNEEALTGKNKSDGTTDKVIYSLIEWGKSIINDLGLGFGWAAFYFSVLTSLLKGQTIGKKLLRIKVIQLDGTPLSLWDSFGRYGGYGAGLATGFLGFLQIYWDPNRQAIHDKISATIVIDLKK